MAGNVTITEDGAEALLAGVAAQARQDVIARQGVTVADRFEAWEFLRHIGLNRQQLHRLLSTAEALQEKCSHAQANARIVKISAKTGSK